MAGCELRCRWLDLNAIEYTRRRERRAGGLFPRRDDRERIRPPLLRGAEGRDRGWRVSGPDDELTPRIGAALHKTLWAHIGILDADRTTDPDEGAT